jgi:large subunit ribosomal protein L25
MATATAARKSVETFLSREVLNKATHIKHYGPLPTLKGAAAETLGPPAEQLPNPFLPHLNVKSKRWAPPKYSLRQQAVLAKQAKAAGLLHLIPPGPKTPILDPTNPTVQKYNPRFAAAAERAFKAQAARTETKPGKATLPVKKDASWIAGNILEGSKVDKAIYWEGKIDLKRKAGADLGTKLYAGKRRMFKGHQWERLKEGRDKKRAVLMRDMAKRIEVYKNVRSTAFPKFHTLTDLTTSVLQEEASRSSQASQDHPQGWQTPLLIFPTTLDIITSHFPLLLCFPLSSIQSCIYE